MQHTKRTKIEKKSLQANFTGKVFPRIQTRKKYQLQMNIQCVTCINKPEYVADTKSKA